MIEEIIVHGLKRFAEQSLEFAPLTVLAGLNGSGKTSFLQAILLTCEASTTRSTSLRLNGPFGLDLGTAGDVLNWRSESPISILMRTEDDILEWKFGIPSDDALYLDILERPPVAPEAFSSRARSFTYLSAERLGPRGFSEASPVAQDDLEIGSRGEYCAHVLSVLGDRIIVYPERSHPLYDGKKPRLLKYEVEQWLGEIARPIEVTADRPQNSTVVELRFRIPGDATWVRSTNMGFGITHTLPIVLGGLIANAGGVLVVENPEAHLHPSGQSRVGAFLAWLAGKGIQVVLETHSDHVLNGIRRAIAEHKFLPSSGAIIHYFGGDDRAADEPEIPTSLTISETGSLSGWPRGFFDQYQLDVASLGQLRRRQ